MKNNIMKTFLLGALCLPFLIQAQDVKLDVDVTRRGIEISPTHYGLFLKISTTRRMGDCMRS